MNIFYKFKNKIKEISNIFLSKRNIRISSYPFISGDSFIAIADCAVLKSSSEPLVLRNKIKKEIIFIEIDCLKDKAILDLALSYKKVILHNSDNPPSLKIQERFINKNIKVFSTNVKYKKNKIYPIPIGLENAHYDQNGSVKYFNSLNIANINKNKRNLILVSFQIHNKKRKIYNDRLKKFNLKNNFNLKKHIYRDLLAKSYFVLSPPGNGVDCHRTWEAIYHNAIPVIEKKDYFF